MSTKEEPWGDHIGDAFDDGIYDGVRKVIVGEDRAHGVAYLTVEYIKDGKIVTKQHGRKMELQMTESTFSVVYPNEYITRIVVRQYGGRHPRKALVLRFFTSLGRSSEAFGIASTAYLGECRGVSFCGGGTKLVGLHGHCDGVLTSLGARFALVSSAHSPVRPRGGRYGEPWDDGAFAGVRSIMIGEKKNYLSYIRIQYLKLPSAWGDGSVEELITHSHGKRPPEELKEFVLLDDEYITSVEGTYDDDDDTAASERCLTSLTFLTSTRRSQTFGKPVGREFFIKGEGIHGKLASFKGISNFDCLKALGANFTVAPPLKVMEVKGGDVGEGWDDGVHESVHRIVVLCGLGHIWGIRFEYLEANNEIEILHEQYHGEWFRKGAKEHTFQLSPDEYLTSVEGFLSDYNHNTRCITMLQIRTNKGTVKQFGESTTGQIRQVSWQDRPKWFVMQKEHHKIVGFFGRSSKYLEEIGVYLKPISG